MGEVRIRTVTVTRPLKVISFTCCCFTLLLLTAATSTSDWMVAEGWREGLFMQCIDASAPTPLPFHMAAQEGCRVARTSPSTAACAVLALLGLLADLLGTLVTGLGLKSTDPNKKYKYYRVATYLLTASLALLTLANTIFPICFARELAAAPPKDGGIVSDIIVANIDINPDPASQALASRCQELGAAEQAACGPRTFAVGFGYCCTWACSLALLVAVVLLVCDRQSQEIYYRECRKGAGGEHEEVVKEEVMEEDLNNGTPV